MRAPIGTRIEDTETIIGEVEAEIRRIISPLELQTINDNIGVPISYNLAFVASDNIGSQDGEILIQLKADHHPSRQYMTTMRHQLAAKFPNLKIYFLPADVVTQVLNFGVASMLDVQIESRDVEVAYAVARSLYDQIRRVPGAEDVRIAQVLNHPALLLEVDRQQAAQLNLTERDVANSLVTSLSSSSLVSPNFWNNPLTGVNYLVAVQTPITRVASVSDLLRTPLSPALGGASAADTTNNAPSPLPNPLQRLPPLSGQSNFTAPYLGGVATLRPTEDPAAVNHYTVQPVVDVQASVQARDLGGVASLWREPSCPPACRSCCAVKPRA